MSRFKASLQELIRSFPADGKSSRPRVVADLYGSLVQHTIVIDAFFGSVIVFVPPTLKLDIAAVCALSGYVQSCGELAFVGRVDETQKEVFLDAVERHLDRFPPKGKAFFTVYAHEDFTKFDRSLEGDLRDGLDDVKIYVEKFFMGSARLVSVLSEMRDRFASVLEIPEPGDYRQRHREFRESKGADRSRTLWLVADRTLGSEPRQPGTERCFICYDQRYANRNPFQFFEENMPGWRAHTTIPHTLAAAMLNVTVPWWPRDRRITLCDPFAGTATIPLEAKKYGELRVDASDIEPIAPLLAGDNLRFFSSSPDELQRLEALLGELVAIDEGVTWDLSGGRPVSKSVKMLKEMADALGPVVSQSGKDQPTLPGRVAERLAKREFEFRLLFYLGLRSTYRNVAAFERGSRDWLAAFKKEAEELRVQTTALRELRDAELSKGLGTEGPISIYQSSYSLGCTVGLPWLRKVKNGQTRGFVRVRDARLLSRNSCDLIVTDPPYGFNTDENPIELARLYSEVLDSCIRALRDNGQLVLCLMDRSHIGRQAAFFTHKEIVIQQVLDKARRQRREIVVQPGLVPEPTQFFKAPYYWESERALRRAILHFRLRWLPGQTRKG